jgi:hypothetical protein
MSSRFPDRRQCPDSMSKRRGRSTSNQPVAYEQRLIRGLMPGNFIVRKVGPIRIDVIEATAVPTCCDDGRAIAELATRRRPTGILLATGHPATSDVPPSLGLRGRLGRNRRSAKEADRSGERHRSGPSNRAGPRGIDEVAGTADPALRPAELVLISSAGTVRGAREIDKNDEDLHAFLMFGMLECE